jgi:CelD/BcsL family acetyltransferase involved in cellulose biosynthesis
MTTPVFAARAFGLANHEANAELEWRDQLAYLNFRVGEFEIGSLKLPMSVPQGDFWELRSRPDPARMAPKPDRGVLLRSLPVDAPLPTLVRRAEALVYVPKCYRRYMTDMRMDAEAFLSGLSGKSRNTLKRKIRKFEEEFGSPITWREYRDEDEVDEYFATARKVSARTFQERLLDVGLPDTPSFIDQTRAEARRGDWRGYVLQAQGQAIAYVHCPIVRGVALYAFVGFDPAYAQWSPGTILQWLLMERMFADDHVHWFDFTEGEGPHKAFFSTHHWYCADVWVLAPTLRNWLIVGLHVGLDRTGVLAGLALDRLGLKQRVRRLMRRR